MAKKQKTQSKTRRRPRKGRAVRLLVFVTAFIAVIFLGLYGLIHLKNWVLKDVPKEERITSTQFSALVRGVDGDIVDALFETGVSSRDIRSRKVFRKERGELKWDYKDTHIKLPEGISEGRLKSTLAKSLGNGDIRQKFKKTDNYLVSDISIYGIPTHRLRFDFTVKKPQEPKKAAAEKKTAPTPTPVKAAAKPDKEIAKADAETPLPREAEKELLREKLTVPPRETKEAKAAPSGKNSLPTPAPKQVAKIDTEKKPPIRETEKKLFGERPKVAIIIDDLGLDKHSVNKLIEIQASLTFSVLPHLPNSTYAASEAHKNGRDVMLHLPMEPKEALGRGVNPGSGSLLVGLPKEEILTRLERDIAAVPYIKGANNHMGSKFTEDAELMEVVLRELKSEGLFFVDSRTSARSTGYGLAKELGIKTAQRDYFLDNTRSEAYIKSQLLKFVSFSKANGYGIAICHPYPETIKVLTEMIPLIKDEVEIIPISKMVK